MNKSNRWLQFINTQIIYAANCASVVDVDLLLSKYADVSVSACSSWPVRVNMYTGPTKHFGKYMTNFFYFTKFTQPCSCHKGQCQEAVGTWRASQVAAL